MSGSLQALDISENRYVHWSGDSPNVARFYDAMLSGKDNFAVDRAVAREVAMLAPGVPRLLHDNRAFVTRAVRHMAGQGITQFLDLGCGLPTADNTHQIAQRCDPAARVVYIDRDPVVVLHGYAFLADNSQTAVVGADVRDPCEVFEAVEVRHLLDLSRPVGVLLTLTLHHVHDDDDPRGLVRSYMDRLPAGSMLAISHFHAAETEPPSDGRAREVEHLLLAALGSGWFRSRAAIAAFFDGLDIDRHGLRPLEHRRTWTGRPHGSSMALCGLARKP